jgi:hypothetical protein
MSIQSDNAEQAAWAATKTPPADIGVEELTKFLVGLGIRESAIRCFADPYDPISPGWVENILAPVWKDEINRQGLNKIKGDNPEDGANCVDFAQGAVWIGQVHYKRLNRGRAGALCDIAFDAAGIGEHALIGRVSRNADRSLAIAFFEPQPHQTVGGFVTVVLQPRTLTAEELHSATDIAFYG